MSDSADLTVPERGDAMWLELDPQAGHEQAGHRPVLVISPADYNRRVGLAVVCPITSVKKGYPFEVEIYATEITGVVLADQVKSLDWKARRGRFVENVGDEIVNEVVARLLPLIDPEEVFGGPRVAS